MKERYINAVVSYFSENKKEIRKQLNEDLSEVTTEEQLLTFGHPKVMAFEYGYRNNFKDYLNHPSLKALNNTIYLLINIYFAVIIVLSQMKLYFNNADIQRFIQSPVISFLTNNGIIIICIIAAVYVVVSLILVERNDQARPKKWNIDILRNLPVEITYHFRSNEVILDYIATVIAIVFFLVYHNPRIVKDSTICTLFEPYVLLMGCDIIYSYKERINHKKCNRNRIVVNLVSLVGLILILLNTNYVTFSIVSFEQVVLLSLVISMLVLNIYNIIINNIIYFKLYIKTTE